MSFDFGNSNQASDPTADFLARERANAGALEGDADLFGGSAAGGAGPAGSMGAALAGGAGGTAAGSADRDFVSGASAFPALDGDADAAPAPADDDLLGGGGAAAPAADPARNEFEDKFPELNEPEPEPAAAHTAETVSLSTEPWACLLVI